MRNNRKLIRKIKIIVSAVLCVSMLGGTIIFSAADTAGTAGINADARAAQDVSGSDMPDGIADSADDAESDIIYVAADGSISDEFTIEDSTGAEAAPGSEEGEASDEGTDEPADADEKVNETNQTNENLNNDTDNEMENNDADGKAADSDDEAAEDEDASLDTDEDTELYEAASDEGKTNEWYQQCLESGSYEINTAAELYAFAETVNNGITTFSGKTIVLGADIDLAKTDESAESDGTSLKGWEPVGTSSSYFFTGIFNGNGHTIKNLTYTGSDASVKYTGLFGYLTGKVTGLTLENASIQSVSKYTGAVAGYMTAGASVTDCKTAAVTLKSSGAFTGMIAGYTAGTLKDINISGSIDCDAKEVTASADENYDEAAGVYAGGTAGYAAVAELRHIINRADVTLAAAGSGVTDAVYVGGIAGMTTGTKLVINCGNSGAVVCSGDREAKAGGLAGGSDAADIKNCWNKGAVNCSSTVEKAAAGGLLGESFAGAIYNCYSDAASVKGTVASTGYIVGCISGTEATSLDYVYWPGSGTYTSTLVYGKGGKAAAANSTCRGISKIPSSSSLIKRLNTQVCSSADDETLTTELYMWELIDKDAPKSSPEFRESAPAPVFPNKPQIAPESTAVGLHPDDADASHEAVLAAAVSNTDADVIMTYQWQISTNGEKYENVPDMSGSSTETEGYTGKDTAYKVTGTDTGVRYYRLRVTCSDDKADTSKSYYSDVITVTTGYRIKISAGGLMDGSAQITDGGTASDVFPVVPDSGKVSLPKAESEGRFLMGYAASYEAGQTYSAEDLSMEFDTAGMSSDATLWSVFRQAAAVTVTIDAGSDTAQLKEGVESTALTLAAYEGNEYTLPEGNDLFVNDGYRFIGWHITEAAASDGSESEESDEDKADDKADADEKVYAPGDIYTLGERDITVKAVWSRLYTVTYASDAEFTGELPQQVQYIEGENVEIATADISRDAYKLYGWIDSETGRRYAQGAGYTMPARDVTFTAYWTNIVQVQFFASEDESLEVTGAESLQSVVDVGIGESVLLPEPGDMAVEGYAFVGWSNTSDVGTIFKPGYRYSISMSEAFYGVWYKVSTVTFERGEIAGETISGKDPAQKTCTEKTKIVLPESPYKVTLNKSGIRSYKLIGWLESTTGAVRTVGTTITVGKEDITYTAQWKAIDSESSWSGDSKEIEEGTGTAEDPYLIKTPEELAYVSEIVSKGKDTKGKYFSLENDIDLTDIDWKPIGGREANSETVHYFEGVFDGNGHNITGLTSFIDESGSYPEVGLFGSVGESGKINDLNVLSVEMTVNVKNSDNNALYKYAGIIAGENCGSITDCHTGGTITLKSDISGNTSISFYIGGIAGRSAGGSITGCTNDAQVRYMCSELASDAIAMAGGIVGSAVNTDISSCENNGSVSFESDVYFSNYGGGIAASIEGRSIEGCVNNGDITRNSDGPTMMGGIAGLAKAEIKECENYARVEFIYEADHSGGGTGKYQYMGGIAGDNNKTISDCMNYGDVINTVISAYDRVVAAGGISGLAIGDIQRCGNTGNISANAYVDISSGLDVYEQMSTGSESTVRRANVTAGGIAGELYKSSVNNCYSSGNAAISLTGSDFDFRNSEDNVWLGMSEGGIAGIICGPWSPNRISGATGKDSSIKNCVWLVSSSAAAEDENAYSIYADGSRRIKASDTAAARTATQFAGGEAAYIVDGGAGTRAESWTQADAEPGFGSPQYYKAAADTENSSGAASLQYGTYSGDTLYVPAGGSVYVTTPKGVSGYERAAGEAYDQYDEKVSGGVIHHWKQDYYVNVPDVKVVMAGNGSEVDTSDNDDGTVSFKMPEGDVSVTYEFMSSDDFTSLIANDPGSLKKVTRDESRFEAKADEPEPEPEKPDDNKGKGDGGSGGHGGSKDPASKGNTNNSNDNNGKGDVNKSENGTANGTNGLPSAVISPDGAPSNVVISVPSAMLADETVNAESQPEYAEDPQNPQDNSSESGDPEQETEASEEVDQPEVYEVIKDAVASNPLAALAILLIIIVIFILAAARRIRKNQEK